MEQIAKRIAALGAHERRIILACLERIESGRALYGEWRADDSRNFATETWEEIIDALHYCAAAILRLEDEKHK